MTEDPISRSFEIAAERCEDLTPLVYARLFREEPGLEPMFVLDIGGAARGNMLAQVITALLDRIENGSFGENLIRTEAQNHSGLGVTPEQFGRFFGILVDTLRDLLGADWTDDMTRAWNDQLADLGRIVAPAA